MNHLAWFGGSLYFAPTDFWGWPGGPHPLLASRQQGVSINVTRLRTVSAQIRKVICRPVYCNAARSRWWIQKSHITPSCIDRRYLMTQQAGWWDIQSARKVLPGSTVEWS